jgi:hypothetical protein
MSTTDLGIFIAGGRTAFQPGDTLEVSALWALAGAPEQLEARLFWYTRGKGTEDVGVVSVQRVENPPAAGERAWRFKLPAQPWSFSGKLISLVWAVELVVEPGARSARAEFTLSPDGQEILLHGDSGEAAMSVRSGG